MDKENFAEDQLENEIDLLQYWYVIQRRAWLLITVFVIVVISSLVFTARQQPIYRATTTLIIEPEIPLDESNIVDKNGPILFNSSFFYETQYDIIKSYTVSKKTCEALGLFENPDTFEMNLPESAAESASESEADSEPKPSFRKSVYNLIQSNAVLKSMAETLGIISAKPESAIPQEYDPVPGFQGGITVSPVKDSYLVKVSIDNTDPDTATNYVNTLAKVYIRHNQEDKKSASDDAFSWLSEQLAIFKAKVEKSEAELLKFKEKEDIVSLDKRQILLEEKLSALHDTYNKAVTQSMQLKTISEEMEKLKKNPEMAQSLPRILENPLIQKLKVEYSDLKAQLASISKKYKAKHPRIITLNSQIDNVRDEIIKEVTKISKSIEIEYRISKTNENTIKGNLDKLKQGSMLLAQQAIKYGVLKRDAESNRQMYDVLLNRLKETDISGSITANNIRVVDEARVPGSPIRPNKKRNLMLAMVMGVMLGVGLCFFLEYIDDSLKSEDDVSLYLKIPCMGLAIKEKLKTPLEKEIPKPLVRCYQDIKTALSFYREEHILKTLLITSPAKDEGKTTTALLLGEAFAQADVRTLLVDADLFKAELGKRFQIKEKIGISDYFSKNTPLKELIQETNTPNLHILPAGLITRNPSELIGSIKFKKLLEKIKNDFDMIILDSPPLNISLEVSVLGSYVDGIVVVVRGGKTPRSVAMKMMDKLKSMRGNIIGVILTFASPSNRGYKYYKYYKYYYPGNQDES